MYLGSVYVNSFNKFGRTWQVKVQADHQFRIHPEDIRRLEVRNADGQMIPIGTVVNVDQQLGPQTILRYNLYPAASITGQAAPGFSSGQALNMLAGTIPFSFLPEEVLETVAAEIALVKYSADTVIFIQDRSTVDYLYILQAGAAERYFEDKGKQILKAVLSEGDLFGGISILLNNSIAVRTLRTTEDTSFYILPQKRFRQLCDSHDAFSEYFTDTFGKRMLDRSYAEIAERMGRGEGAVRMLWLRALQRLKSQLEPDSPQPEE